MSPERIKEIEAQLRALVGEELDVEAGEVTREASFMGKEEGGLGADSLDLVELIMKIETTFDIELTDADAEGIETFGNALDCLVAKLTEKEAASA